MHSASSSDQINSHTILDQISTLTTQALEASKALQFDKEILIYDTIITLANILPLKPIDDMIKKDKKTLGDQTTWVMIEAPGVTQFIIHFIQGR